MKLVALSLQHQPLSHLQPASAALLLRCAAACKLELLLRREHGVWWHALHEPHNRGVGWEQVTGGEIPQRTAVFQSELGVSESGAGGDHCKRQDVIINGAGLKGRNVQRELMMAAVRHNQTTKYKQTEVSLIL